MQQSQLPRWEYLVVSCIMNNEQWVVSYVNNRQVQQTLAVDYMQYEGSYGWELVSTHVDPPIGRPSEVMRLFFKRRKS